MEAVINGKTALLNAQTTLSDLLNLYQLNPRVVIIEQNGVILKQPSWATTPIQENDCIELITFVGGG